MHAKDAVREEGASIYLSLLTGNNIDVLIRDVQNQFHAEIPKGGFCFLRIVSIIKVMLYKIPG